jgi:hypothetical protein
MSINKWLYFPRVAHMYLYQSHLTSATFSVGSIKRLSLIKKNIYIIYEIYVQNRSSISKNKIVINRLVWYFTRRMPLQIVEEVKNIYN